MKTLRFFFLVLFIIVIVMSCNLFEPGTGDKVDVDKPTIEMTSHDGGETVKGSITIKGEYNEDIDVEYIRLSFDDGATFKNATVDKKAKKWSLGVDSTEYKDNAYNIIVEIKDTAEKTAKTTFLLYFDNHGPLVLVEFPQNYATDGTLNGTITIQGKAADKYGVASVDVFPYHPDGAPMKSLKKSSTPIIRQKKKMPDGSIMLESKKSFLSRKSSSKDPARNPAIGKESWSITYDSTIDIPASGTYAFFVQATDFAGNKNTYFFHNDDIKEVAGSTILANTLHYIDIDDAEAPEPPPITIENMEPIRKDAVTNKFLLIFNQSADLPEFTFSNPMEGKTAQENAFGANARAVGMIMDDDGIKTDTLQIKITGTGIPSPDWVQIPAENISGSGLSITWQYDLSSLGEGTYALQIRVKDINMIETAAPVESVSVLFSIDEGAPTIDVTSPLNGAYVNGNFTIHGTASDGDQVNRVGVSFDQAPPYTYDYDNVETSDNFQNWTYDVNVSVDETMYIRVAAEDDMGNTAYFNLQVIADITPPLVSFVNPTKSTTVNGIVTLKGISSDNSSITQVELRIGKPENWQLLSGEYNWEYELDCMSYANDTYATNKGGDVWELEIYARATDVAGNVNPDPDPEDVFFIKIDNNTDKPTVNIISPSHGQNIAGPVLISGTAFDDDAVHHVEMLIDVNGDGFFLDKIDFRGDSNGIPDGDTNDMFEDETKVDWYTVEGKTLWTQEINSFGEMYETVPGHDGTITVRVRAVDSKDLGITPDIAGNYQEFTIHLDDTIPRIEDLSHASSDYVSGTFTLTGDALDDVFVDYIGVSYNGGVSYTSIVDNSVVLDGAKVSKNADNDFDLHIQINSTSYIPDSGIFYLRLKIIDDANYQSISYINLNVDNEYPTASWDTVNADPDDIRTTSADVQGEATDTGAVSGIDKVEVYFIRGGNVYDPTTGLTTSQEETDFGDGDGTVPYTTDTDCKIIIDNPIEAGNDGGINGDHDGFNESLTRAGSTYTWWAEFNSTVIPDGTIDIHYVAFDNAGNGDHNVISGLIANDKPQFTGVIVGYDVDDSGSVQTGERFSYSSEFEAANMIYIQLSADDDDTPLTYEVLHEGAGPNLIVSGNSCEIDISSEPEGQTYYLCRVTDSTGVFNSIQIEVNIENDDSSNPTITIDALTQGNVVDGHIELDGDSLHNGTDPDVSGEITIQGTAYDNRGINVITLTLDGESDPTVAVWSGGTLVSDNANFTIDSQTFNGSGHSVSWTYTWDSAAITGHASDNILIDMDITDFSSNPGTDSLTVDVVPYITDIVRFVGEEGTNRSKYGKFAVQEGETNLVLYGYNLAKTGTNYVRVYDSEDTDYDTVNTTKVSVNGSYTQMTLSDLADITHSGWLSIVVNGVEAGNNTNDNTILTNKEDDGNGILSSLWNDDRYLHVWNTGDYFNQSGNAEYPSMSINSSGTLYGAWTDYATSEVYYGTTSSRTSIFYMYDPAEYTDIHIDSSNNLTIAYLGNYYGGSGWDSDINNAGSMNVWNSSAPQQVRRGFGYPWNYFYRFEMLYHNEMLLQFQRPKVVRSGNNIHLAYYDNNTKAVKYGYVANGDTNTSERVWINLDGGQDGDDAQVVSSGRSTYAGEYVAIDVDEDGYPVVMYYDISNQTLKLARSNSTAPSTASNWTLQTVFDTGDPNKNYVGKYITMKFDTTGNLYTACLKTSTGDLVYLHASNVDGTDYDFDSSIVIDSEGSVGAWADMTLNGTTPYISYLNSSMIGTFSGLKVAYYDPVEEVWEHEIVPLNTAIAETRTNIEYKKGTVDWSIAIGYAGNTFDIVYLLPEE
ncbi:MAG: hypothetical protein JXB88_23305 [Spirochaetales bacterium]|nr:hypothetical protein [Spirochaetales bacterium]